ncbi:hypothetical protein [Aestuariibaculum sediminum]|uniref:Ig-like domain-containing protein n=1 Tax=Aestuariibaculum sediminum TaxID=2770637 RepID=A0A8J6Q2Z0_9FLAO|nr:hypothetical protein [Aestuariibaculum sediminum]MBD0832819.1 hypothetical protein [Aestuariibaculum sediminum]
MIGLNTTTKFKVFKILFFLSISNYLLHAQSLELPKVNSLVSVPSSPEAQAFTKYGDMPVSYYAGKPEISIPIYTIQGRELSVPVSITYDASGIKIQSLATSVGAGWNLNSGGMINRQINDLADDMISGKPSREIFDSDVRSFNTYLNSLRNPSNGYYSHFENYEHALLDIIDFQAIKSDQAIGDADLMPDIFSFNAPGLSGSTIINPDTGNAISIDDPDILVNYSKNAGGSIISWTITSVNGTIYYFQKAEETTASYSSDASEGTRIYNSAWHLTKIESPSKRDVFEFVYLDQPYWNQFQSYHNRTIKQNRLTACGEINYDPSLATNTYTITNNLNDYKIKQPIINVIKYNGTEVMRFGYSGNRLDLSGRNKLSSIDIKYGSEVLRTFTLNHSYFMSSNPISEEDYRLRLDSIELQGYYNLQVGETNAPPQIYSFNYYGNGILPGRNSLAIDYLGYYNGKTTNNTLVPKHIDIYGNNFSGADRNADFNYAQKGMLKEIIYPTGGATEFVYDGYLQTDVSTQVKTFSDHLGTVISGADPNADSSEFDCDDGFWYLPHTVTTGFTVDSNNIGSSSFNYGVNSSGNYSQSGRVFFVAIYESSFTKTFCDIQTMIQNGDSKLKYYSYAVPSNGNSFSLNLPAGSYKIYLANSLLGKSFSVNRVYDSNIEVSEVYASTPVISEIIDKTNDGESYTRAFEYLESSVQQKIQFHTIKETYDNGVSSNCREYETLERYSANLYSQTPFEVTFGKVKEIRKDDSGNNIGYSIYEFYNQNFYTIDQVNPYPISGVYVPKIGEPYIKTYPLNGKLKSVTHYDNLDRKLKEEQNTYDFEALLVTSGTTFYGMESFSDACVVAVSGEINTNLKKLTYVTSTNSPNRTCSNHNGFTVINSWKNVSPNSDSNIRFHSFKTQLLQSSVKDIFHDGFPSIPKTLEKVTTYSYGQEHNLPVLTTTESSNGNTVSINTKYPKDIVSRTAPEQLLVDQHKISNPINIITTVSENSTELAKYEVNNIYKNWGSNLVLPEKIQHSKGNVGLEDRVLFNDYDNKGNPLEVSQKNGVPISYIWGYNQMYPIAKIENATRAQIENLSGFGTDFNSGSGGLTTAQESTLRASLTNAMVTTYTYDELIGVLSTTDPSGYRSHFQYDTFGRLKYVKNDAEDVLKEVKYLYGLEEIVGETTSSSTSVVSGESVTLTTTASGGTGDFQYNWTVSNGIINQNYTNTSGVLTITTTDNHAPNFTVTCQILDTQTNDSVITTKTINVTASYSALSVIGVYFSPNGFKSVGDSVNYSVNVSGGSGNYSYDWSKTNSQSTTNYSENSSSISKTVVSSDCTSFSVKCVVTDNVTNEVIIKQALLLVNSGCPNN